MIKVAAFKSLHMNSVQAIKETQNFSTINIFKVVDEVSDLEFKYNNLIDGLNVKKLTIASANPRFAIFNEGKGTFLAVGSSIGFGLDWTSLDLTRNTMIDQSSIEYLRESDAQFEDVERFLTSVLGIV